MKKHSISFYVNLIFIAGCISVNCAGIKPQSADGNASSGTIINKITNMKLSQEYTLQITERNSRLVKWTSGDASIISVDDNGKLSANKPGKAVIFAEFASNKEKNDSVEIEVELDPMYLFEKFHIEKTLRKEVTSFGPSPRKQFVNGSVSLYWTAPLNIETRFINVSTNQYTGKTATAAILSAAEPLKKVRSGILRDEIKYITYHDTENNNPGADANMHADYLSGSYNASFRARSWHYTVDSARVIQHIPDNEITWQGDAYESYAKSIGIETCVNYGSDLYTVWQRTGKLIAALLVKYDLDAGAVRQHYDWSKKNCPQTLRMNNLYQTAIDLVKAEYLVKKYLSGYEITFESLNTEFVNHYGKVIKAPPKNTKVGYVVSIKNSAAGYSESMVFYSTVAGISAD